MTTRTAFVSALLLSAAFALPATASDVSGTTAPTTAGTTASITGATAPGQPATTAPGELPAATASTPATTTGETPPTDVTASGTATPAAPTTAGTETTTATQPVTAGTSTSMPSSEVTASTAAPSTTANVAAGAPNIAPMTAQVGQSVTGANGAKLGTVASSDAQGNIQLTTESGNVSLASGLVSNTDGQLTASSISQMDLKAMAATQHGDPQAAAAASTRAATDRPRHRRHYAGTPAHSTPASATTESSTELNGATGTPQEQPMPPAETQQPAPAQQPAEPTQPETTPSQTQ